MSTVLRSSAGFTLLDMCVSIMISTILLSVAIPRFASLSGTFNRANARSFLIEDIKRAQAESVTQGCRGVFVIDASAKTYSFGCDYLAYDNALPPHWDISSFVRNCPRDITVSSSQPIIFNSRGQTVDTEGVISNTTISLMEEGTVFATGTLTAAGVLNLN